MTSSHPRFAPIEKRMEDENLPSQMIDTFSYYYEMLVSGKTGMIPEADIEPVVTVPDIELLPKTLTEVGRNALSETVIIKLNGGLGTSMGLEKAKSLLPVKDGYSFLEIIAHQAIKTGVPLLLMNSFSTESDSLKALEKYPELQGNLPLSFVQHKVPKIVCSDYTQVEWNKNPEFEWCPPGHGDIYMALITQGVLDALLGAGKKYAFVSNADNLGATLDKSLLGYFAENDFPFMMEVAARTEMDRKGGHLAQRKNDGQLILREVAQCPPEDLEDFQNIQRYKYFNTNNVWINLKSFQQIMIEQGNRLGLPMIRNQKTVDPRESSSTKVYQLETAIGSAIAVFKGSAAIRVPRSRFAPVKKSDDLLVVRSDAFVLTDDFEVVANPRRKSESPGVELDSRYYKFVSDLDSRFPEGVPSLISCDRLNIKGDFLFKKDVICRGYVDLNNDTDKQIAIPSKTILGEQV